MDNNSLTVYWAPASFQKEFESWNLLYKEPTLVQRRLSTLNSGVAGGYFSCPATRISLKNLFEVTSLIDDKAIFAKECFKDIDLMYPQHEEVSLLFDHVPKVNLQRIRPSSFTGYVNLQYNYSWLFIAEEPCVMEMLPPYLPHFSPVQGTMLASGEFDIGQWFRPIVLDYHLPAESPTFTVKENDSLVYFRFKTDKNIVFKRFTMTSSVRSIVSELGNSKTRYGGIKGSPLSYFSKRYSMAKQSKIKELLLFEVTQNLVD